MIDKYNNIVLGYYDYNEKEMKGVDFPTIESACKWLSGVSEHDTEVTKEFFDFAFEKWGKEIFITKMLELYPEFFDCIDMSPIEQIDYIHNNPMVLSASDFIG